MKKLIIVLLALFATASLFAETKLPVSVQINPMNDYGFTATEYKNGAEEMVKLSGTQDITNGGDKFFASVRTNSTKSSTITITHTNLTLKDQGGIVIDTIPLTVNNTTATESFSFTDPGTQALRAYSKQLSFAFDGATATAGVYTATVTMTIAEI